MADYEKNKISGITSVIHEIDEDDDDLVCSETNIEYALKTAISGDQDVVQEKEDFIKRECQDIEYLDSKDTGADDENESIIVAGNEQTNSAESEYANVKFEDETQEYNNISDNESAYTNDSFCSDESADESQHNSFITLSSMKPSDPYPSPILNKDEKEQDRISGERSILRNRNERHKSLMNSVESLVIKDRCSTASKRTPSRRKNMTFTSWELRKIEMENEILVRKIMSQRRPQSRMMREENFRRRESSSAINRKKFERRVAQDNMLLLEKIRQAKPCVVPNSHTPGYRTTYL